MKLLSTVAAAAALTLVGFGASAATYVYDFAAAADGAVGESAWTSYNTDGLGVGGPTIEVTAGDTAQQEGSPYVYFDRDNAGIGVCNTLESGAPINTNTGSGTNLCDPSNDDGMTTTGEFLVFTAVDALTLEEIWINSNHDAASVLDTVWDILVNDVLWGTFSLADFGTGLYDSTGNIILSLGIDLFAGDYVTLIGTTGPNSYVSAIAVSPIPVPAAGWLMIAGLGGLAAMRRRKS